MPRLRALAIVGASLAGLRAAETLRAEGCDARITLIGSEPHAPYDRPPLSKEILRGEWDASCLALRREGLESLALDLRLGRRAVALDPRRCIVALDDGSNVKFDGLVIATGAEPRRLGAHKLAGVHVLRTVDDALALRADLERAPRVAIVGAGFIGLEAAASCRARGLDVTVIEPQAAPLAAVLGGEMGEFCAALHRERGVALRLGLSVAELRGGDRVESVVLNDGSILKADVVIVGIGVRPATDWLRDCGMALDDGIVCDAHCATSLPSVVAAGDVARWYNPLFGELMRVEHWTNAAEQGAAAVRSLLHGAAAPAFAPVPTFWSDQYDIKIQFGGRAPAGSEVRIVAGDLPDQRFVALYGFQGRIVGVLAVRRSAQFVRYCDLIARRATWQEALGSA